MFPNISSTDLQAQITSVQGYAQVSLGAFYPFGVWIVGAVLGILFLVMLINVFKWVIAHLPGHEDYTETYHETEMGQTVTLAQAYRAQQARKKMSKFD